MSDPWNDYTASCPQALSRAGIVVRWLSHMRDSLGGQLAAGIALDTGASFGDEICAGSTRSSSEFVPGTRARFDAQVSTPWVLADRLFRR